MGKLIFTKASSLPGNVIKSLARPDPAPTASTPPKKQMLLTNSNYSIQRTKIPSSRPAGSCPDIKGSHLQARSTKNSTISSGQAKVIQEEMEKLLEAGFIREVEYPEWLSNVVMVPKKGGKWRVCVDYTNLNDACPKDSFPLPRIDQIVDVTSGHEVLSFLDAFFGYHQIPMAPDDEEKTSFITPHGLCCYRVMPFGLKNARATYQRLMTKIFKPLISDVV
ncbi:Transposon Ty3-I Gag-Pol polyprotein [Vitis vinifera]|uniref:Transposon Ty3-I Gag-Pol polyprotein n=1 Tax=Vitis vinifera TaxID=29760 RepID=A0A438KDT8_VITVI|nr:Transposon Ty3-I Gag-Pol polyprotein [Vitis vinifera]